MHIETDALARHFRIAEGIWETIPLTRLPPDFGRRWPGDGCPHSMIVTKISRAFRFVPRYPRRPHRIFRTHRGFFFGGGDGWVALGPWRYHPTRRRDKVTHVSSAMTTGTLVSGQGYEVSTNDDGFWEPENGSHRNADIFIECLTVVETRAEC